MFQKSFCGLHCILTIVRYPKYSGFAGLLSMALFRLPLLFNKDITFWKLLGCGKNGTFDIHPDWRQYAVLAVGNFQSCSIQLPVSCLVGLNYQAQNKQYCQLQTDLRFFHKLVVAIF